MATPVTTGPVLCSTCPLTSSTARTDRLLTDARGLELSAARSQAGGPPDFTRAMPVTETKGARLQNSLTDQPKRRERS